MATGVFRSETRHVLPCHPASCCPGDEDLHSPSTDASEDSVEVKVLPILALSKKNKRKLAEPRKLSDTSPTPVKRQRRVPCRVTEVITPTSPFRPWSEQAKTVPSSEEPLSLVLRPDTEQTPSPALCGGRPTVPQLPHTSQRRPSSKFSVESLLGDARVDLPPPSRSQNPPKAQSSRGGGSTSGHPAQRNYKNMTRERRIEANARERTRVHTISAAFDTLRSSIPSYSHSQKLSKLSILRIACSYIVFLSRVNGMDYSQGASAPTVADCVDTVSRTLHAEGKVRKKKDEQ